MSCEHRRNLRTWPSRKPHESSNKPSASIRARQKRPAKSVRRLLKKPRHCASWRRSIHATRAVLRKNGVLDYGDLIVLAVTALCDPAVAAELHAQYRYIL